MSVRYRTHVFFFITRHALVNRIGLRSSKEVYDAANQTVGQVIDHPIGLAN
jgi:hypothetical protein